MAKRWYNPDTGSNSTGDGSENNPWQYPTSSHGAAGDTFRLKRGAMHMCANNYGWLPKMSQPGGPTTYIRAYGEAQIPHALIDNAHANGPTLNIGGGSTTRAELVIEDLWVTAAGNPSYPIYIHSQDGALENISLRRCKATDKGAQRSGFFISSDNPETQVNRNILLEDCEAYGNDEHGILWSSTINGIARRCRTSNNGLGTGAHGMSAWKTRTNLTSGWSLVSGTTYQRTMTEITQSGTDISAVIVLSGASAATYPRLIKNTATPSAPALGEFGYVPGAGTGVLYVNLGTTPVGQTLNACYGTLSGLRFEYCQSWGNRAYAAYTYHEGHGFALDDFTSDSFIIGCESWDNEGCGISVNRGDNNTITGNVLHDNLWPGLAMSRGRGNRIINNTSFGNNLAASHNGFTNGNLADIVIGSMSVNTLIENNLIFQAMRDYGIQVDASSASGSIAVTNYIEGLVGRISGISESAAFHAAVAGMVHRDGRLLVPYMLEGVPMLNPLGGAGTYVQGVRLMDGQRAQPGRTPIGAYAEGRY